MEILAKGFPYIRYIRMKKTSLTLLAIGLLHSFPAQAGQAMNNQLFTELTQGQRHWYLVGAHSSMAHMIGLENQQQSKCVLDWFFDDIDKRSETILKNAMRYPKHSPTTIIIASLRRACNILPKK